MKPFILLTKCEARVYYVGLGLTQKRKPQRERQVGSPMPSANSSQYFFPHAMQRFVRGFFLLDPFMFRL